MGNWSKRYTTRGSGGQRITRTHNTRGVSTISNSKKVGNRRTTISTNSSNGKIKILTTESHPTLGIKRTVETVNKTQRNRSTQAAQRRRRRGGSRTVYSSRPAQSMSALVIAGNLAFYIGMAYFILMIKFFWLKIVALISLLIFGIIHAIVADDIASEEASNSPEQG